MALIKCPECQKEVSDKTYKCPNCGFVLNKPKRTITGLIFYSLFVLFNFIMLLIIGSQVYLAFSIDNYSSFFSATMIVIIIIWIFIGLPLALMNYLTRPKAYE